MNITLITVITTSLGQNRLGLHHPGLHHHGLLKAGLNHPGLPKAGLNQNRLGLSRPGLRIAGQSHLIAGQNLHIAGQSHPGRHTVGQNPLGRLIVGRSLPILGQNLLQNRGLTNHKASVADDNRFFFGNLFSSWNIFLALVYFWREDALWFFISHPLCERIGFFVDGSVVWIITKNSG